MKTTPRSPAVAACPSFVAARSLSSLFAFWIALAALFAFFAPTAFGAPKTTPKITSFTASPASITAGQSTTLSWSVSNATSLSIDQGVGTVSGTSISVTPAATTTYTLTARNNYGTKTASTTVTVSPPSGSVNVTITVDPSSTRAISPYVYGINFYGSIANAPRNLTFNRTGGNRWTAYNWENNASNAGSDWNYSNDSYLGGGETPAEAVRSVIAADRSRGQASLMTIQLQGYVSADKNGNVDINDPNRFTTRFKQGVYQKGSAFTDTPTTADATVYMDEFLWSLRNKFPGDLYTDAATPTFVSLDNEPDLWSSTHPEIQPTAPTPDQLIQKTASLANALKAIEPGVVIFGPVNYGFNGLVNFQNASGFSSSYWFVDKYLLDLKTASTNAGKRLLDVYDFHWYSEAYAGSTRVISLTGSSLTVDQVQAIVQSPRSLWDPTYTENSWVANYLGGPVRILDRLQAKIDADWPGTKLAVTEYDNGGDNHIAGAIAQADNLGIFGSRGVFAANFWPMSSSYPFILAGFKMYRDYDGNLGTFGDTSLSATSSDVSKVAAYVSRHSATPNKYVIVALNRSTAAQTIGFNGLALSGQAKVYRISGTQTSPSLISQGAVDLATWTVSLPALSVSTIEIITP